MRNKQRVITHRERDHGVLTYDEIGALLGLTKSMVVRIERIALAKLAVALGDEGALDRLPDWIKRGGTPGAPGRKPHVCGKCGKRGHNARSCGRAPIRW